MNRKDAIELARKLRKRQTQSESIVWSLLRNQRVAGLKFRRQHPIEYSFLGESNFFIADFFNYK